jgi:hypothetical protein
MRGKVKYGIPFKLSILVLSTSKVKTRHFLNLGAHIFGAIESYDHCCLTLSSKLEHLPLGDTTILVYYSWLKDITVKLCLSLEA